MLHIQETEEFSHWLASLRDPHARARILVRIRRLALKNPGDVMPVGAGVSELRIHYGPGYRVYFKQFGGMLVIILGGGTKKTQARDIARAQALASELEE